MLRSFSWLLLVGIIGCGSPADDSTAIKEHEAIQQQFKTADAERLKAAKENVALREQINKQELVLESRSREIESVTRENGKLSARIAGLAEELDQRLKESRKAAVNSEPAPDRLPTNAVTREQFTKSLIENSGNLRIRSSTPKQVIGLYGKPDATWTTAGRTYWRYDHRTYDPAANKLDREAVIEFNGDDIVGGATGVAIVTYR